MKKFSLVISLPLLAAFFWFNTLSAQTNIGDTAPEFNLKDVSGKMISMDSFEGAKGFIVVFTCNHCPYSKLYEDRLIALDNEYALKGFPVIAINPNDDVAYPSDSYKKMKKRAKEKKFPFPYLRDESQEVAKAYGATRTPHIFLVDNTESRTVTYIGALDDNPKSAEMVEEHFLEDAIKAMENGERIDPATTKAVGCGIKWKKS